MTKKGSCRLVSTVSIFCVAIGSAISCSSTRAHVERQAAQEVASASGREQSSRRELTSDELHALLRERSPLAILGIRTIPHHRFDSPPGGGLAVYLWDDGLVVYRDSVNSAVHEARIGIIRRPELDELQRSLDAMPGQYGLVRRSGQDTIGDSVATIDISGAYPLIHVWARLTNGECVHVAWDQLIEADYRNLPHGALESLVQVRDEFLPRVRALLPRESVAFSEYEELVLKSRHWIEGSWTVLPGCD